MASEWTCHLCHVYVNFHTDTCASLAIRLMSRRLFHSGVDLVTSLSQYNHPCSTSTDHNQRGLPKLYTSLESRLSILKFVSQLWRQIRMENLVQDYGCTVFRCLLLLVHWTLHFYCSIQYHWPLTLRITFLTWLPHYWEVCQYPYVAVHIMHFSIQYRKSLIRIHWDHRILG